MNPSVSFCSYYDRGICRSCSEIERPYPEQIRVKEEKLRQALLRNGGPAIDSSLPTVTSREQGMRNRAKLSVTGTVDAPVIGLLGVSDLDEGRELLDCPIHHPKLNEVLRGLPDFIRRFRLIPYSIARREGELKGVIAFYAEESGEMYLRFVLRSQECVSRLRKMLPEFQAAFPFVVCLSANLQPIPHAILEGPKEIYVTERTFIRHPLDGIPFRLSPQAFVQTNASVATLLYREAAEWIAESGARRMLELYCGQGPFSFFAAKRSSVLEKAVGVEINPEAVQTANETARSLGLNRLSFRALDATQAEAVAGEFRALDPEIVLVNPPRRGIGKEGVALLLAQRPKTVLYSSCSHETLALDLAGLAGSYRVKRARIFDLFPHTDHFEVLVELALQ